MKRILSFYLPLVCTALALLAAGALLLARRAAPETPETAPRTLVITELMTQNSVGLTDSAGRHCQWVELYNASGETVALGDYTLNCGAESTPLPARALAPGEYALVTSSDWGFLIPTHGTLTLVRHGRAIFSLTYANGGENCSYLAATGGESMQPTPGYAEPRAADALILSEAVTNNDDSPINGSLRDWVELYNAGDMPLALGDFYLSRDAGKPYDCRLPQQTLESGAYIVLTCGDELDFNLSKEGVSLFLTRSDGVGCSALSIPALQSGESFTYDRGVAAPTPGAANTDANAQRAAGGAGPLRINEVLLSNASYWPVNGECYDLVELYNAGDAPLALDGYYLSKSKNEPLRWQLPAVTLQSGEYYVAVCSGRGGDEAPFKLSASGERIYLTRADGYVADVLSVPAVPNDRSWGRSAGGLVYFSTPTPGAPNGSGFPDLSAAPAASVLSGFYDEPFTVTLSGEGDIYYTTDGSNPDISGTLYHGETISVTASMSLRAYSRRGERIPSENVTYNYFLGLPAYELDIVKISLSPYYFSQDLSFDDNVGEFHANIALYSQGEEQFSAGCAISLFGSGSRMYPKKSYQIDFQSGYGPTKLRYQLFDGLAIDEFNGFVLRSGAQDLCYATLRDEFITSLFGACSDDILVQAYRPVNLYVNDQYRGLYYIRERVTGDMIASHYGVSPESVTIVRNVETAALSTDPDTRELGELLEYIRAQDMSDPAAYAHVTERLDMESLIDFYIAEMWSTNFDIGNVKFFRSTENDGLWRLVLYDLDVSFLKYNYNSVSLMYTAYDGVLASLLQNSGFLEQYTARLAQLLDGPLQEDAVLAQLDALVARLDHDMHYNCELWSDYKTYDGWLKEIEFLKSEPDKGIQGWNEALKRQYIQIVQPGAALIEKYFGRDYI